ncbi:MAG: hypothetical protein IPO93_05980 [Actinobacteria bacterium]|nr:hypothetical protein [Actinomycetota bacterium]
MSRRLRGTAARLGFALVCAPALAGVLVAPAPPAFADDADKPSVQVVLDRFTPVVATLDDSLRIDGRIISTGTATLTNVAVQLRRSSAPLTSRADVTAVLDAEMTPADGDPDGISLTATQSVVTDSLPPGERRPFSIVIPIADLGLASPGTYVLGIEVTGQEAGVDSTSVRKADQRTFLPWFPTADSVTPLRVVWLWPLADWPARTASGALLNNRTPTELSPGGRLDRLVTIGNRFRGTVSWIADPSLLQTASDMTRGYQVVRGDTAVLGDKEGAAQAWLDDLADATKSAGIRTMPYADVDASAVVRAGMSNDVVRAVTQGPGVAAAALGSQAPGGLYWAPFGRLDRNTTNVLASAGVTTIVLSADALPATDPALPTDGLATAALPTSVGAMRAVLTDPGLMQALALPQRSASDVIAARQRFLAETAVLATSIPADQASRIVVVAPESVRWDPTSSLIAPLLRATRTAPWLSTMSLDQLLEEPVSSASRQRGGYGTKARAAELSAEYMALVRRTSAQLESFTSIVDDPTGLSEPFYAALLRAESAGWRSNPGTGQDLLSRTAAELAGEMAGVRVLSEGTITFSGDTGRVPVTITNGLDRSVTVGLALVGSPALRLSSEPLTSIRIDAGKMASVDIDARVVGGDPLTVNVQLLTPEMTPYGKPARITVTSTAYARAASWVVAAAFVAIVVFVVVGVTRRIRKAQEGRVHSDLGR